MDKGAFPAEEEEKEPILEAGTGATPECAGTGETYQPMFVLTPRQNGLFLSYNFSTVTVFNFSETISDKSAIFFAKSQEYKLQNHLAGYFHTILTL